MKHEMHYLAALSIADDVREVCELDKSPKDYALISMAAELRNLDQQHGALLETNRLAIDLLNTWQKQIRDQ